MARFPLATVLVSLFGASLADEASIDGRWAMDLFPTTGRPQAQEPNPDRGTVVVDTTGLTFGPNPAFWSGALSGKRAYERISPGLGVARAPLECDDEGNSFLLVRRDDDWLVLTPAGCVSSDELCERWARGERDVFDNVPNDLNSIYYLPWVHETEASR